MSGNFRENLRSELDFQDVTVKELGEKTGIPKATLECYLGARANMPSADAAVKIARALGVTVEYLVTGEEGGPAGRIPERGKKRELVKLVASLDDAGCEVVSAVAFAAASKTYYGANDERGIGNGGKQTTNLNGNVLAQPHEHERRHQRKSS